MRLLPATIFFAALLLSVKVGDLWLGPSEGGRIAVAGLHAETPKKEKAQEHPKKGDKAQAEKTATEKARKDETKKAKEGEDKAAEAEREQDAADQPFDISRLTRHDVALLQQLWARRQELEKRARALDLREQVIVAAEHKVDGKIARMKKIEAVIAGLLKKHDAQEEAKLKSVVKIYEKMKPKDAARIFENLDMDILLSVVERMKEAKTAPILARMAQTKAKDLTIELANRRILPETLAAAGGEASD